MKEKHKIKDDKKQTTSYHVKYTAIGIIVAFLVIVGILLYPFIKFYVHEKIIENKIIQKRTEYNQKLLKTPKEYYNMFQCSCCGQPIDTNCCGMAKQRKEYVDKLLLEGIEENELVYRMVKKFGFGILMDPSKEQEVRSYIKSKASENPPHIEIENPKYDFGILKQTDGIVTTTFTIKNTGGSDLVIENMDTSCMCTEANLIYKGEEGPKFGMSMHGDNPEDYSLIIPPGESALLKVYYDPNAHGKQKKPELKITREVTITSNDPVDFQKKVRIELTQVP